MGLVDEVSRMQKTGMDDSNIINILKKRGVSPQEIENTLNQVKVKGAIDNEEQPLQEEVNKYDQQQARGFMGMQPSIMDNPNYAAAPLPEAQYNNQSSPQASSQQYYSNQNQYAAPQGTYTQEFGAPTPDQSQPEYSDQQYAPQDQQYDQQQYYEPTTGVDLDMVTEIAEQVSEEKVATLKRALENMNEFRILTKTKIDHMESQVQHLQDTIDKLQIAILDKVGSYVQGIDDIKKETAMIQQSFSKMIKPSNVENKTRVSKQEEEIFDEDENPIKKALRNVKSSGKSSSRNYIQ